MPGVTTVDLIIQANCLQIADCNSMLQVFDLKGSTHQRSVIDFQKITTSDTVSTTQSSKSIKKSLFDMLPDGLAKFLSTNTEPLKDVDYVHLSQNFKQSSLFNIDLDTTDIRRIQRAIRADTSFLARNQLMDYSLLLGFEKVEESSI